MIIKMEGQDIDIRKNIISRYQPDAKVLVRYIPWLEEKRGSSIMDSYEGEGMMKTAFKFPVYDSTLLSFVKTAQKTQFMTRNYQYVYNRKRIRNIKQELELIHSASYRDIETLSGILSRYVLGGMTKASLWEQAVEYGVFVELLYKLRELMETDR